MLFVAAAAITYVELRHSTFNFQATHWLSLAGVIAALSQWAITSVLTLYNARRQHTITVLLQSRLSPAYQQRLRDVVKGYPTMPAISKVAVGDWNDPAKLEALEGIKYLLNYFEFVAIGIRIGDLDEATMRRSLADIVMALTAVAEQYIKFSRGELDTNDGFPSNNAYSELLWLKARWQQS